MRALLLVLLLAGCVRVPSASVEQVKPNEEARVNDMVYRVVDKQLGVVCYYMTYNARVAISCLPLLEPEAPEVE